MFFTQEDYRKIEKWFLANSRKDTDFVGAATPLKGNETVVLVQNGKNVKASVKDVVEQLFLLGVSDFVNITDKYGESYISLSQAIELIPYRSRKIGQVVTFLDDTGKWAMFQFQGTRKNQWGTLSLWVDLIDLMTGLTITDSEDIVTETNSANQVALKFADKVYSTTDYSGLGRVYLRKSIVNVEDPVTGNVVKMNYLTQSMISKENTTYIVQYSYNLNKQTISIPEGSILVFEGGDINNGTINCNGTVIVGKFGGNATITGTYSFQDAQADEEDITQSQSSVLKFKDKEYDEANFSGLGRTYLRKNIVNGVNILSQDMINNSNTIYHIQYDYNLNGQTITIPEGCTIDFQGGSFNNGTLVLNNTIIYNLYNFSNTLIVQGSMKNIKGISPELFGYSPDLDKDTSIKILDAYTKYVNTTEGCYFLINRRDYYYRLYKPLVFQKDVIGVGRPRFVWSNSEQVIAGEGYTLPNNQPWLDQKAVICIVPRSYTSEIDRLTIKNIEIYCSDNTINNPRQDIGFYFPMGNNFLLDNIAVYQSNDSGFRFVENWMGEMSRLFSFYGNDVGIAFGRRGYGGTFTSLNVHNLYAQECKYGIGVNGAMYSTFSDLACDQIKNPEGTTYDGVYSIGSCWATNFNNLGAEGCTAPNLITIGDSTINLCGIFSSGCKISHAFTYIFSASVVRLSSIHLHQNTIDKILPENTPYFIRIEGKASETKRMSITINTAMSTMLFGDYTGSISVKQESTGQYIKVDTDDLKYIFKDNVYTYVTEFNNPIEFGVSTSFPTATEVNNKLGVPQSSQNIFLGRITGNDNLGMYIGSAFGTISGKGLMVYNTNKTEKVTLVNAGANQIISEVPLQLEYISTSRPSDINAGFCMFDSTLGKPIWAKSVSDGIVTWVDATGTTV